MNISFEKLFELRLMHDYFSDGICRPLQLRPTGKCQSYLQRFGLRFRPLSGGGAVYYQISHDSGETNNPILPIDEETCFTFALFSDDSHFLNYTDLPFSSPGDSCYYFSNLNALAVDGNPLVLGRQAKVTEEDSVYLRPKLFVISIAGKPEEITVLDGTGRLLEGVVTPLEEKQENYRVDLRAYKSGLYILQHNTDEKIVCYVDDDLFQQKVFGVVEFFAGESIAEENRFVDISHPLKITPQTYSIHYEKRATFWRYFVIPRALEEVDAEKMRVFHEKGMFAFRKIGAANTASGEHAVIFQSDEPIPLDMTPIKDLTLQIERNGADFLPVIEHLPAPKISAIQIDPASGTVYSDVFVYI